MGVRDDRLRVYCADQPGIFRGFALLFAAGLFSLAGLVGGIWFLIDKLWG